MIAQTVEAPPATAAASTDRESAIRRFALAEAHSSLPWLPTSDTRCSSLELSELLRKGMIERNLPHRVYRLTVLGESVAGIKAAPRIDLEAEVRARIRRHKPLKEISEEIVAELAEDALRPALHQAMAALVVQIAEEIGYYDSPEVAKRKRAAEPGPRAPQRSRRWAQAAELGEDPLAWIVHPPSAPEGIPLASCSAEDCLQLASMHQEKARVFQARAEGLTALAELMATEGAETVAELDPEAVQEALA